MFRSNLFSIAFAGALALQVVAAPSAGPHGAAMRRFYANDSFWNVPIGGRAPLDPNSATIVAQAILPYARNATLSNSEEWGMPLAYADSSAKVYKIACTIYCTGDTVSFPIPAGARPATGSDHHLVVIHGNQELDLWEASYDPHRDTWSAGTRVINDLNGWGAFCREGKHCNGAVASGFAALGGVVRPEEIAQGHIDHALALITPLTKAGYIACPATHTDGRSKSVGAIPEGARVQLDPSFNVDAQSWPAWQKIIARALQTYGAYVVDTSGALALRGVTDQNPGTLTWASVGVPDNAPSLRNFPWNRLRVLEFRSCN